ncbi:filamin-A-like [Sycon ciliatum]|uniref:filamin-A-like n=1 Tax=Sycon ciliatum TaxID=27933 RepID=UPI0020AC5B9F|eukprot:scpid88052/ scgid24017/ Filamin-A; Actin-binding protein 280; Alpha-filamin; Endothelial actin-binding protein; Filamin-1; Non-muscle filamin
MSCKVSGPALVSGGVQGQDVCVLVDTTEAGGGKLTYHVTGPSRTELSNRMQDECPGMYQASFVPHHAGEYSLDVRFNDEPVPGSPFSIQVRSDSSYEPPKGNAQKVVCSGDGLSTCRINQAAYFSVDSSRAGLGRLSMEMSGPSQPSITYADDGAPGTFQYTVSALGDYELHIRWGAEDVPHSPFQISVEDENGVVPVIQGDPAKVLATGLGLDMCTVGETNKFTVDPRNAGAGHVSVTVEGPGHTGVQLQHADDGTIDVMYAPPADGDYTINVTFSGIHIEGSPFNATAIAQPPPLI